MSDLDRLDEHDITKSMLNTIREVNMPGKKVSELEQLADVDKNKLESELQKFSEIADSFKFGVFNIYRQTSNAVFSGELTEFNIEFEMVLVESDGLYINCNQTKLTDTVFDVLGRLKGYYKNWKKDWYKYMREEYKPTPSAGVGSNQPDDPSGMTAAEKNFNQGSRAE